MHQRYHQDHVKWSTCIITGAYNSQSFPSLRGVSVALWGSRCPVPVRCAGSSQRPLAWRCSWSWPQQAWLQFAAPAWPVPVAKGKGKTHVHVAIEPWIIFVLWYCEMNLPPSQSPWSNLVEWDYKNQLPKTRNFGEKFLLAWMHFYDFECVSRTLIGTSLSTWLHVCHTNYLR